MVLSQKSAASTISLAAYVNGLGNATFSRIAPKTDTWTRNNSGKSIIDNTDEEAVAQLCLYFTE